MIRAPTESDCERFAALHAESFDPAWDTPAFRTLLQSSGVMALTNESGFVVIRVAADEAEVLTIAVASKGRRKGQGRALLGSAIEAARREGARRLFLEVSGANHAARALYAQLGFTQAGLRKGYYADGADALVLALTLA